jgi:sortase A
MTDVVDMMGDVTQELPLIKRSTRHGGRSPVQGSEPGDAPPIDLIADILGSQVAVRAQRTRPPLARALDGVRSAVATAERHRVVGVVIGGLGVLLLILLGYIYVFTPLSAGRAQHALLQTISSNPTRSFDLAEGRIPAEGQPIAILEIPALQLTQAVVQGSDAQDLRQGPGHMLTTVLPGQPGNSVIAGRRATYGAPFGAIGSLKRGDQIRVVDGYGVFRYRVAGIATAAAGTRDVVTPTADNRLTLVTAGSGVLPSGRLAVIARLEGKPFTEAPIPTFDPATAQLGLDGDAASGLLALIWSLVFFALLGTMVWGLSFWRQPVVVLLLGVPVLLVAGLFACESLVGLLPATL